MTHTLVTIPCTARELDNALLYICEHYGAWDAEIRYGLRDIEPFRTGVKGVPTLEIEIETKGENKMSMEYGMECLAVSLEGVERKSTALLKNHGDRLADWQKHRIAHIRDEARSLLDTLYGEKAQTDGICNPSGEGVAESRSGTGAHPQAVESSAGTGRV